MHPVHIISVHPFSYFDVYPAHVAVSPVYYTTIASEMYASTCTCPYQVVSAITMSCKYYKLPLALCTHLCSHRPK